MRHYLKNGEWHDRPGKYDALSVVYYVIKYSNEANYYINAVKMQPLLYLIQAKFLVEKGFPCFYEEIEAWDSGVIIPRIHRYLSIFGNGSLIDILPYDKEYITDIHPVDKADIREVCDEFAFYSGFDMSKMLRDTKPWKDAIRRRKNNPIMLIGGLYEEITNEAIVEYYKED